MKYSDVEKHKWFELLQIGSNPYNYERYLYNTGIVVGKQSPAHYLFFEVSKNSNMQEYSINLETFTPAFWWSKNIKEIEYKNPPVSSGKTNRIFIEKIFTNKAINKK